MQNTNQDSFFFKWLNRRLDPQADEGKRRAAAGRAASVVGLGCNALLFAAKLVIGVVSGSVAIVADAINNLSDASSGVVSLLGFKLAERPADAKHPYGHGRYEYLSALTVAVMILAIGLDLLKSGVGKILHPTPVSFSWVTVIVLALAIGVKLWMSVFYRHVADRIDSPALAASADDSRNDVVSTGGVLIATLIAHFTGLALDGWVGALVAGFILVSGVGLVRETVDRMLGQPASREQMEHIRDKICAYPDVLGVHDLLVHDYGPGRLFASVHVEISDSISPIVSHDLIDNIERSFLEEDHLHLVIHYDPVATDDPRVTTMRAFLKDTVHQIHPHMSVHDVRIVAGPTHVNVIFDCVVPYDCKLNDDTIQKTIQQETAKQYPNYYCVVTIEHSFVEA